MMRARETLVLTASDVARALPPAECREAIERALLLLAKGLAPAPRATGYEAPGGTFHAKVALLDMGAPRFVAKINGNFPGNPEAHGLPTIQGVLLLADAADGRPLALMDSGALTAIRTAAASMVAVRHLARPEPGAAAILGCGAQGLAHIDALLGLAPIPEIRLFDIDRTRAERAAASIPARGGPTRARVASSVADAVRGADVVVTCTSARSFVLGAEDVGPGAFVAAVGTDNPHKREIEPGLMRRARVVVDDLAQCARGGDLHHALDAGVMTQEDVHGELAAVVAGATPGRADDTAIFLFDSTGIALEDAAAAGIVYERARAEGLGTAVRFAS